jgi:hypothetical protein
MRRRRKPSLVCSLLFWIPLVSLWPLVQQLQLQQGPPHSRTIDSHKIIDHNDSDSLHRRKKSLHVLIAAHGALLASASFMPPGAALVELFTHGYVKPRFFRPFVLSAGARHFS